MPAEVASIPPPVALPPPLPPPSSVAPEALAPIPPPPADTHGLDATCANCGQALAGPFCSRCGQHVRDFHRSVWRFVVDFFDNAFCWDNKLFLTLKPLLGQPGALTLDYLSGRRVRYVHPFRLFLFTSAICLTLMQWLGGGPVNTDFNADFSDQKPRQHSRSSQSRKEVAPAPDVSPAASSAPPGPEASTEKPPTAKAPGDDDPGEAYPAKGLAAQIARTVREEQAKAARARSGGSPAAGAEEDDNKWVEDWAKAKFAAAGGQAGVREHLKKINEDVQRRLSWVALALLPIFAMMLRSLYWRRDSYYFAHFVFSLHYHTFLLIFGAAYILLGKLLPGWSIVQVPKVCLLAAPGVYLFLALRRMYGDSIKRTLAKVLVLGSMHLLTLVIGLSAVGALASYKEFKDVANTPASATPALPKTPEGVPAP